MKITCFVTAAVMAFGPMLSMGVGDALAAPSSASASAKTSSQHTKTGHHRKRHRLRAICTRAAKKNHLTGAKARAEVKSCVAVHRACWHKAKARHLPKGHERRTFVKACLKE